MFHTQTKISVRFRDGRHINDTIDELHPGMFYLFRLWLHIVTKDMLTHDFWRTLTWYDDWFPTLEIPAEKVAGPCRTTNE